MTNQGTAGGSSGSSPRPFGTGPRRPAVRRRGVFARLRTYFFAGILVTAPVGLTIWLIWRFVEYVDGTVIPLIPEGYNPERYLEHSVPGLGVLVLLLVITVIGALATNFMGRFLMRMAERVVARVPIVRSIYGLLKQIFDAVLAQSSTAFREVILLEYPRRGTWAIGFITSSPRQEITERLGPNMINVFVPTTPNPTSGFLLIVPEADVLRLPITVEDGIKLVISGGIVSGDEAAAESAARKARHAPK